MGKQAFGRGAVPKPELGFEDGMKNLFNSLCIKLLDTHPHSGPPSRNGALVVDSYHICHCFVLSRFGHACGIWRHICAIVAAPSSSLVHLCTVRNCPSCSNCCFQPVAKRLLLRETLLLQLKPVYWGGQLYFSGQVSWACTDCLSHVPLETFCISTRTRVFSFLQYLAFVCLFLGEVLKSSLLQER